MSKNIFVGSLAWGTTSEGIEQAFAQYGVVTSAKVISDRETGRSKGFAFVEMETGGDEAIKALNGSDMDGRQIVVNEARPREERSGGGGGGGGYGGGGGGRSGGGGGGRSGGGGGYGDSQENAACHAHCPRGGGRPHQPNLTRAGIATASRTQVLLTRC